jgi:hypothetical protein
MGKDKNGKNGKGVLANPFRLKPLDPDDKQVLQVVIETPKGSRNKYGFDPEQKIFELKKVPLISELIGEAQPRWSVSDAGIALRGRMWLMTRKTQTESLRSL